MQRIILKELNYSFGGLKIVFLNNNTIQVEGSYHQVSGFGTTKSFKFTGSVIHVKVNVNKIEKAWGNKLFKLEINDNTIKAISEQRDKEDPAYVKHEDWNSEFTYQFPIPGWLEKTGAIDKFQIVIAAMNNADISFNEIWIE